MEDGTFPGAELDVVDRKEVEEDSNNVPNQTEDPFYDTVSSPSIKETLPESVQITTREEEDSIIFHCVSYLGAAKIHEANNESEIQKIITFLNEQSSEKVIQVSVSVPFYSDGDVIVYEEENQQEISRFKINQIIFFARGNSTIKNDAACFGFTCSHGKTLREAIFKCHTFRCDVPEAVGRVYQSFATAFSAPPRERDVKVVADVSVDRTSSNLVESHEYTVFEVSLEFKEDDGKGNFHAVPRDKGYFKLKSSISKQIVLTVQQADSSKELIVERCFGLLLSPGRHVRHSDMQLVELLSWSIGSIGIDRKSYVVTGSWDCNDPVFEPLNQETSKESYIFLTVAVDLVIKGIQEPIRFAIETKAKIYPAAERFWILTRKHHVTQQFGLTLQQVQGNIKGSAVYKVVDCRALGEVDKNKIHFNLNFTSFIRSSSIGSIDLETPTKDEDESDDDEPLQSGVGEISKDCSDEQIAAWSDILNIWPVDCPNRPKQLAPLVRAGIPDAMRNNMWMRLANCDDEPKMFEVYKNLMTKEYSQDDVILRDISRTFPANDYFKESGTGQDLLFKISRGYAVYDTEVGYCQGISFIGAAFLLQMPEEQAFYLLVKIMFDYGFRDLYRDGFDNLHLSLYQLDKLVQDQIPELWTHFQELGIESHMYASQWFLTCFCGKFPLVFVFRVIDIILLDGFKTIFQIAIALLAAARKDLLVLDFEGILKYFRVSLPKKYRSPESTNFLIRSAYTVKVKRLKRYKKEYIAVKEQERNYVDPVTRLTNDNKKLMDDIMRYEYTVTNLVLAKTATEERCLQLEEELARTKISLNEKQEINSQLEEETNSVKELFQREVKQYDKKEKIISEYKQICTKLSSQLEVEQKLSRERLNFFQSNLCPACFQFVTAAINITSSGRSNGSSGDSSESDRPLEDIVKPLENELAKTKIALAESECLNDDMNHKLQMALAELETYRNNSSSGSTWLWKNLSFSKEHKKATNSNSLPPEEPTLCHSQSMPPIIPTFSKK